ncbi:MAG: hypothetical protein ACI9EW_000839 [Cellvibrionaceae bacterium]|jgi:hypothetical protein
MPQSENQKHSNDDHALIMARLQELLLKQERARVDELESELVSMETEIEWLHSELARTKADFVPIITQHMSEITQNAVETQRSKMAQALSPIIGEATRYQILNSREEMVEALYPIVGAAVVRAVSEAIRDLTRRIDSQIRPANSGRVEQTIINRIRGIDPGELALRNALPFEINQIFLIQHDSGLVLEFINQKSDAVTDHDLISSMLTAIRSFVNDSFSPGENDDELHEVTFGDERIILESGTTAYIAAVISGSEPEGFRSLLRTLVNELHIQYKEELRDFDGDRSTLPDFTSLINQFVQDSTGNGLNGGIEKGAKPSQNRLFRIAAVLFAALLLGLCLFYGWLTMRMLPYALSGYQPTQLPVIVEVTRIVYAPTQTREPTSTVTNTPTPIATSTLTPTPAFTPTESPTNTPTQRPSLTPSVEPSLVEQLIIVYPVWSRADPNANAPEYFAIPAGTVVEVLQRVDGWIEIRWSDRWQGPVVTWVKESWVNGSN